MNPVAAVIAVQNPQALRGILWGGLVCGVMDITAAFVVFVQNEWSSAWSSTSSASGFPSRSRCDGTQ